MKEASETTTDPILEECYRVKEELSAKFSNIQTICQPFQIELSK
jgi:hypothetical protein